METFQRFFEQIVELCIKVGLVWREELYFDRTKVQANANINFRSSFQELLDRAEPYRHREAYQKAMRKRSVG